MKIRTLYFVVREMEPAVSFWQAFFGFEPGKRSAYWSEFKCENINLGLLLDEPDMKRSNCVPVFELPAEKLEEVKNRALSLGAKIEVDISRHPDKQSYVLKDPFENEFEITRFRG